MNIFRWIINRIVSLILIILLLPIYIIIAFICLITQGFPIFYKYKVVGKNKKIFTFIKFRSMRKHKENQAPFTREPDYVTPFGKFLRKFSLDELPQLFLVLIGKMNLIGLRPLKLSEAVLYDNWYFEDLPGCLSDSQLSVNKGHVEIVERQKLDYHFYCNNCLKYRLKLLFKAIKYIISGNNQ